MKILAVDPGGTTGIAWHDFELGLSVRPGHSMPVGFGQSSEFIQLYVTSFKPDLIVCEKFTITPATFKKSREGSNLAIELIGVTRWLAKQSNTPIEEQTPSDAKSFVTDEKLKRIGWYVPGPDHARDAIRHLLLAGVRHRTFNTKEIVSG